MWTFTSSKVITPKETARRWHHLSVHLRNDYPGLPLVRVFELHPGVKVNGQEYSHGLHVHAVLPFRLDINKVRKRAIQAGFGRIHAKVLEANKCSAYLTKYLTKQKREKYASLKGMRLWAGLNFKHVKVKNTTKNNFASWYIKRHLYNIQPDFYQSLDAIQKAYPILRPTVLKFLGKNSRNLLHPATRNFLYTSEAFSHLFPEKKFVGQFKMLFLSRVLNELYYPLLSYYAEQELNPYLWFYQGQSKVYYNPPASPNSPYRELEAA